MTTLRFPPLLSALFSACLAEGCSSPSCNELPCLKAYSIEFEAASWGHGKYTVELVVDGKTGTCEATLPLDASSRSICTLPGVELGLWPPEQQKLGGLGFDNPPTKVEVSVKLDGVTLGQPASFTPVYGNSYPNGRECVPCREAYDKLML